jgi:hypothetical protein
MWLYAPAEGACIILAEVILVAEHLGASAAALQGVVDADFRFIDIYCGWTGRIHDQRLFNESPLGRELSSAISERYADMTSNLVVIDEDYQMNYVLVADSAYATHPFILPCFKDTDANTPERRAYNTKLSKTRVVVEQAYGFLKNRWRLLLKPIELELSNVVVVVAACCVLHNFCQVERQPVPDPDHELRALVAAYQDMYPSGIAGTQTQLQQQLVQGGEAVVMERGAAMRERVVNYVTSELALLH